MFSIDTNQAHLGRNPHPSLCMSALDALDVLRAGGRLTFTGRDWKQITLGLNDFDAVHASPPCQRYTRGNAGHDTSDYPDLIEPTRLRLVETGLPYIIENVADAREELREPMLLCGSMFGLSAPDEDGHPLRMERHRLFESNRLLLAPSGCAHDPNVTVAGSYGGARQAKGTPEMRRYEAKKVRKGGYVPRKAVLEDLLGIDWMTVEGLYECIPPVYTQWLGAQLATAPTRLFADQMALF